MNRNPLDLTQAKILIVDYVPANIGTLRAPLETAGYQVLATSGEDALEAVADLVPDLILLDGMMPGLDGWDGRARCIGSELGGRAPPELRAPSSFIRLT